MRGLTRFVAALGIAQIVSWGTLFYAIGVLGAPMRRELGVSELFTFSAFTAGLLVAGAFAPLTGRTIDARGGRLAMSTGSLLGAIAMALLAAAPNAAVMVAGWLVAGAAMAATLYDPAFATLSQHAGERYRRAVTALTLYGGFASTVFWPLSLVLLEAWGWRATFAIYAGLHLLVCLPIHLAIPPAAHLGGGHPVPPAPLRADARLRALAVCFALGTFVFGVVAVHMINLLTASGLTPAQAVTLSMLAGPLQVAGRVVEMATARHFRAVTVGFVALGMMVAALAALGAVSGMDAAAVLFIVAYGVGNGLLTVVKGTAPAELLGRDALGAKLGYLARAGSYAKALAPAAYSGLLAAGFTRHAALVALGGLGVAALAALAYARKVRSGGDRALPA